jgi:hypothetical protein
MRLYGKVESRADRVAKSFWRLCWGLVFVCIMTMLSERIPQQFGCADGSAARTVAPASLHHFIK